MEEVHVSQLDDGSSSGRAAKRPRHADNDDAPSFVSNGDGLQLPPEIWVGVMAYLPLESIVSFGAVSRSMLHDVMPLLTALYVDKSSQMNLDVARRFRDIEVIHIYSLLTSSVLDHLEGETWREISAVDLESASRVVPFLSRFNKLQQVSFRPKDEDGKVLANADIASHYFWEGEEWYPNEGSRESMLHFLDQVSIGFRCGALPKHLKISGLCCPDTKNRGGHRGNRCETCLRACRSFPVESVVRFECRGSSASNALSGRFHGLDVCMERARIESIIESRPGGPELLRSEERVLRLLGSARRYNVGDVYIAKYTKAEMDEINRVIKYADLDPQKMNPQTLSDAIMQSFVSVNDSSSPKHLRYVSEESLDYLKDTLGLPFSKDDLERPLMDLAGHAPEIINALISACRGECDITLELDCLRLVRRLVEEIDNLRPIDGIKDLIPSLAKYLKGSDVKVQKEAVRALNNILLKGSHEHKDTAIAAGAIPPLSILFCSSVECIATSALSALRAILAGGKKEDVKQFASGKTIARCIAVLGSKVVGVATDSLALLVAAKDRVNFAAEPRLLVPHLVRIIKSSEQTDTLGNCFVLLRHVMEIDDPPVEDVVNAGIASRLVEIMAATADEGIRTNVAHIMMDLAHYHCQILSNPGGKEQPGVLVKEAGYLSTLLDLQTSPCTEIAAKAVSTLHSVASSNVTEKWTSWKEKESLAFGEFEVAGEVAGVLDDDDASFEEAEEVSDEHARLEEMQVATNRVQVDRATIDTSNVESGNGTPTLLGIPDKLLEKILHYAADNATSEAVSFEPVCKRLYKMLRGDDFWAYSTRESTLNIHSLRWIRAFQKSGDRNEIRFVLGGEMEYTFGDGLGHVRSSELETIRTLSANLLSKMIHSGPEANFRLRGDAAWSLMEIVQSHMVERLAEALLMAIHCQRTEVKEEGWQRTEVTEEDILFIFRKDVLFSPASYCSVTSPTKFNLGTKQPGIVQPFDLSPCLPLNERSGGDTDQPQSHQSPSGIVWRWPEDNCCNVLPEEAGRRIIRRLAYRAGITEMSNGAFVAAEAELLHAWGILLADAYEASVELSKTATYLTADDLLVYRRPAVFADALIPPPSSSLEADSASQNATTKSLVRHLDMFKVPPPPFKVPREDTAEGEDCQYDTVHTVVPGQLVEAAERRDIGPSDVYGDGWISTPAPATEQDQDQLPTEREIEESYYFGPYDEDFPDGFYESDEEEEQTGQPGTDGQESNEISS